MRTVLTMHFSQLNPGPVGDGPRDLVVAGEKIYQEGIPEANVPACSACHGPEAHGKAEIPRLAGQLYTYTLKELTRWSVERGHGPPKEDLSSVMAPITHNLSQSQTAAVAAYLSYLK
jgi:cytochrome c553